MAKVFFGEQADAAVASLQLEEQDCFATGALTVSVAQQAPDAFSEVDDFLVALSPACKDVLRAKTDSAMRKESFFILLIDHP